MLFVKFSIAYLNECNYQLLVRLLQAGNSIIIMFSFQLNGMVILTFRGRKRERERCFNKSLFFFAPCLKLACYFCLEDESPLKVYNLTIVSLSKQKHKQPSKQNQKVNPPLCHDIGHKNILVPQSLI